MSRQAFDLRWPARRRWLSGAWVWLVAGGLGVLLLLVVLSREKLSRSTSPLARQKLFRSSLIEDLNITVEMLSPYSFTRQIIYQMSLAKTLVEVSKDNNNFQFAAELSSQIQKCQALLSTAAMMETSL